MKQAILLFLLILFGIGIYINFFSNQDDAQLNTLISDESSHNESESTEGATEMTEETTEGATENVDEASSETDESTEGTNETLVFSQEQTDALYQSALENGETIEVLLFLPSYYSDGFVNNLQSRFNDDVFNFSRQDLNTNSQNLDLLSTGNADIVFLDALQIADYNDEILFQRNRNNVVLVYQNIYNNDQVPYIIGNANVYDDNLLNVLEQDSTFYEENDFYAISNTDVAGNLEGIYSNEVETEIINNIYDYLVE